MKETDTLRAQFTYGEGIQNYFNDAPIDVGLKSNGGNTVTPVTGEALPIFGMVVALDHTWNDKWTTAAFYSRVDVTNSDLQAPNAYKNGPVLRGQPADHPGQERDDGRRVPVGGPRRTSPTGSASNDIRLQFSFKYSFSGEGNRRVSDVKTITHAVSRVGCGRCRRRRRGLTLSVHAQNNVQAVVDAAFAKYKDLKEGKNADYIPALAKVDPNLFGIALVTPDGKVYTAGDLTTQVSIQSISKVFTMAQVIQEQGLDSVEKRIGVDATGARFNSIIAVEAVKTVVGTGAPEMNPLVNPGAISATSMVKGANADEVWKKIIGFHNDMAGRQLTVLQDVYKSESDSNQRNQAIGALMLAYGYIKSNWPQAVDLYTRQCSIGVNAKDLGDDGGDAGVPAARTRSRASRCSTPAKVPGVLAVMATAGLYDDSGKWLYHTGLPAKSGVGGGIIAVSPGKFGIAVVSPPLDDAGNSIRAQRAIADISNALGGNPYAVKK